MATDSDSPKTAAEGAASAPAPELRLIDRRAFVGFPPLPVAPGLVISDFGLQIPDVSFPFNVSAGPTRYQRKRLLFGFLELSVDAGCRRPRTGPGRPSTTREDRVRRPTATCARPRSAHSRWPL